MAVGRGFVEEEHVDAAAGNPTTAVLSYRLWQGAFNGDPGIVGSTVPSGSASVTVVGVASPDFDYPVGADLWVAYLPPLNFTGQFLEAVGRL